MRRQLPYPPLPGQTPPMQICITEKAAAQFHFASLESFRTSGLGRVRAPATLAQARAPATLPHKRTIIGANTCRTKDTGMGEVRWPRLAVSIHGTQFGDRSISGLLSFGKSLMASAGRSSA